MTISATGADHAIETKIDLLASDFPTDYVFSADGDDVRVFESDDTTPVDFFITGWDVAAQTATIYVRLPTIPSGNSETIYIYLGDNALCAGGNAPSVFPGTGIRLHSRVSTVDPIDAAAGRTAFEAATTDVYDALRNSVNGVNNRSLGGTNGNFGWCVSALINVPTAGDWDFRYGGDFGRGGHLYVDETPLEEDWNDDLWWAGNYGNTAETLSGTINLTTGWHRYEAMGFEGCCDGGVGFQARAPGGSWQNLTTANFTMRGAYCAMPDANINVAAPESCSTILDASKAVEIDSSSPVNYAIPTAIMRYDLNISNPGQTVDATTIVLTDTFPPDVSLMVSGPDVFTLEDGTIPSGLSLPYGGPSDFSDGVEFSTDGVNFTTYAPSSPLDVNVTHIRFRPIGSLNPNDAGDIPSFTIKVFGEIP